jgi:Pyruvate/2-oxoacid:ferredoxin oxidoreductase delta subunit
MVIPPEGTLKHQQTRVNKNKQTKRQQTSINKQESTKTNKLSVNKPEAACCRFCSAFIPQSILAEAIGTLNLPSRIFYREFYREKALQSVLLLEPALSLRLKILINKQELDEGRSEAILKGTL